MHRYTIDLEDTSDGVDRCDTALGNLSDLALDAHATFSNLIITDASHAVYITIEFDATPADALAYVEFYGAEITRA